MRKDSRLWFLIACLAVLAFPSRGTAQSSAFGPTDPLFYAANTNLNMQFGDGPDFADIPITQMRVATTNPSVLTSAAALGPGALVTLNLFDDQSYIIRFADYDYVHADRALDPGALPVWIGTVVAPDEALDSRMPTGMAALMIQDNAITGRVFFRNQHFRLQAYPDGSGKSLVVQLAPPPGNVTTLFASEEEPATTVALPSVPPPALSMVLYVLIARAPLARHYAFYDIFTANTMTWNTREDYEAEIAEMNLVLKLQFADYGFRDITWNAVKLANIIDVDSRDEVTTSATTTRMHEAVDWQWWWNTHGDPNRADLIHYASFWNENPDRYDCGATFKRDTWGSVSNRHPFCVFWGWSMLHELGHSLGADHDPEADPKPSLQYDGEFIVACGSDGDCESGYFCNPQGNCETRGRGWYSYLYESQGDEYYVADVMSYWSNGCKNRVGGDLDDWVDRCFIMPWYSSSALQSYIRIGNGMPLAVGSATKDNMFWITKLYDKWTNWRGTR